MLDKISYESIFNEPLESFPKCIKGDNMSTHEIKISKNKLFVPNISKEGLLNRNPKVANILLNGSHIPDNFHNEIVYSSLDPLQTVAIWDYSIPKNLIGLVRYYIEKDINDVYHQFQLI